MATFNAVNFQASRVNEPAGKVSVKELHGRVRRLYDSYTLGAELAVNDVIKAGVLPSGAKIVDARIVAPADSAAGIVNMGWASNGKDAADPDGLFVGADFGGAALDSKMSAVVAGYNKELQAETELELVCTEATTDSTGNVLQWEVYYIVD